MDVLIKSGTMPNIAYEPWAWVGKEGNARLDSEMADWSYEDAHDGWRIDAPRDVVRGWVDSLRDERDALRRENERLQGVVKQQADSFAKMERRLAEAYEQIDEMRNAVLRDTFGGDHMAVDSPPNHLEPF